ncbi:MAG: hypothetical protein ACREC0_02625 [Methylocella sp.]
MRAIQWRTNPDGMLAVAGVHDGHVDQLRYDETSLHLGIRQPTGARIELTLSGAQEANLTLWNGSIVSEIYIWRVGDVPVGAAPDAGWNALFADILSEKDRLSAAEKIVNRNPNAYLFQLDCSYGGSIACIADGVSVSAE